MLRTEDFFTAIKEGKRDEVSAALERDPGLLTARENGLSPILVALYHGEPAIADDLLRRGPELDVFEASAAGATERVRELLATDPALANAYATDGFTPLGLASFFKRPEVVRFLLARGADPNAAARNRFRFAPLHSATADTPHLGIVRMLLEAGADANVRQWHKATPLHNAAWSDDVDVVALLLQKGADAAARTAKGETALEIARERGNARVADLLARRSA